MKWGPRGSSPLKMNKLLKFFSLKPAERRLLLRAFLLLVAIRAGLLLLPFQMQQRALFRLRRNSLGAPVSNSGLADQIAWAVKTASPWVPGASCLTQALTVKFLLTRAGLPHQVHIGVAKDEKGQFHAHAWVENREGVLIGGCQLEQYTSICTLDELFSRTSPGPPRLF
jgi:hypothetical protein